MAAPSPAASPTRILAEAASRNTPSSGSRARWRWLGCGAGRGDGDGGLAGKPRKVVLHGLELGDWPLEGDALVGIADGEIEDASSAPAICMARAAAPISSKA